MELQKTTLEKQFKQIVHLIQKARGNAFKKLTTELINLYWQAGQYVSQKVENKAWEKSIVQQLADYLYQKIPDLKGFSSRNIWRMKQFYETYKDFPQLHPLLQEIPWSSHLHILSKTKTIEEKEFYLRLSDKEKYSKRELERQIDSAYYERCMISKVKVSLPARKIYPDITSVFRDTYLLDVLNLPQDFSEKDLQKAITHNLKSFILEFGRDIAFVGEEYRVQVGTNDYFIDLLFFHRDLRCLVACELKIDEFKPEYIGQLNFYLEALDRDVKKPHENPSVGVVLCKSKNAEVVEYALSRSLSPALVAEYKTKLIDKKILQRKLHELFEFSSVSALLCSESLGKKAKQILQFCVEAKKRSEIFEAIKLANQTKNFRLHIQPLLESSYLELTIPDKPRSKNQKYQTTESGLQLLQA